MSRCSCCKSKCGCSDISNGDNICVTINSCESQCAYKLRGLPNTDSRVQYYNSIFGQMRTIVYPQVSFSINEQPQTQIFTNNYEGTKSHSISIFLDTILNNHGKDNTIKYYLIFPVPVYTTFDDTTPSFPFYKYYSYGYGALIGEDGRISTTVRFDDLKQLRITHTPGTSSIWNNSAPPSCVNGAFFEYQIDFGEFGLSKGIKDAQTQYVLDTGLWLRTGYAFNPFAPTFGVGGFSVNYFGPEVGFLVAVCNHDVYPIEQNYNTIMNIQFNFGAVIKHQTHNAYGQKISCPANITCINSDSSPSGPFTPYTVTQTGWGNVRHELSAAKLNGFVCGTESTDKCISAIERTSGDWISIFNKFIPSTHEFNPIALSQISDTDIVYKNQSIAANADYPYIKYQYSISGSNEDAYNEYIGLGWPDYFVPSLLIGGSNSYTYNPDNDNFLEFDIGYVLPYTGNTQRVASARLSGLMTKMSNTNPADYGCSPQITQASLNAYCESCYSVYIDGLGYISKYFHLSELVSGYGVFGTSGVDLVYNNGVWTGTANRYIWCGVRGKELNTVTYNLTFDSNGAHLNVISSGGNTFNETYNLLNDNTCNLLINNIRFDYKDNGQHIVNSAFDSYVSCATSSTGTIDYNIEVSYLLIPLFRWLA